MHILYVYLFYKTNSQIKQTKKQKKIAKFFSFPLSTTDLYSNYWFLILREEREGRKKKKRGKKVLL